MLLAILSAFCRVKLPVMSALLAMALRTTNVSPIEIEDALLRHPAIAQVCAVGASDAVHGQNVHAFVTLRPGTTAPTEEELRRFADANLSRPTVPQRIHIVAELPRTGAGKIDRDRLQWQAEAGASALVDS